MNCYLTKSLFFFAFVLSFAANAQTTQGQFFDARPNTSQACTAASFRTEIEAYLQPNIQKYRTKPNPVPESHPYLTFPIRQIPSFAGFNPFGISNFVDHNKNFGPEDFNKYSATNLDYNCGQRTYDTRTAQNHTGTDIFLQPFDWQKMKSNEGEVIAAARGVIIGKYDGNASFNCGSLNNSVTWNAVYVMHPDNSVAWYGHLKEGSLTQKPIGSEVEEGEFLGIVGSSGSSTAPHLHFELRDANNKVIDPFFGPCNNTVTESWWKSQLPYIDKGLNGITTHQIQPITFVCPSNANKPNESYNLRKNTLGYFYLWGKGMQKDEPISLSLYRPNNTLYLNSSSKAPANYDSFYWYWYQAISKNEPSGKWRIRAIYNSKLYDSTFYLANENDIIPTLEGRAFCAGENISISYSKGTGVYPAGNIFTAQLSDLNGSFASPLILGTNASPDNGSINASIPLTIAAGDNYRIRVVSSQGEALSVDNGYNLQIRKTPKATLSGTTSIEPGKSTGIIADFTGGAPYHVLLSDNQGKTFDNDKGSFTVSPAESSTYSLKNIRNACGIGTVSGEAQVKIIILANELPAGHTITVAPVPAENYCKILFDLPTPLEVSYQLLDTKGQQLAKKNLGSIMHLKQHLDLSDLEAGEYLIRIKAGKDIITRKLIKY